MNETRSSSGEPLSHEVFNNLPPGALEPRSLKNTIMKMIIIPKANVEWHCNDYDRLKRITDILSLLAALFSIVASVLTIICH